MVESYQFSCPKMGKWRYGNTALCPPLSQLASLFQVDPPRARVRQGPVPRPESRHGHRGPGDEAKAESSALFSSRLLADWVPLKRYFVILKYLIQCRSPYLGAILFNFLIDMENPGAFFRGSFANGISWSVVLLFVIQSVTAPASLG